MEVALKTVTPPLRYPLKSALSLAFSPKGFGTSWLKAFAFYLTPKPPSLRLWRTTTPFLTSGELLRYAKNSPTCFTERGWSCASLRRGWRCPHCGGRGCSPLKSRCASLTRRFPPCGSPLVSSLGRFETFSLRSKSLRDSPTAWTVGHGIQSIT